MPITTYTPILNIVPWGADTLNLEAVAPNFGWNNDRFGELTANWDRGRMYRLVSAYESQINNVSPFKSIAGITTYDIATRAPIAFLNLMPLLIDFLPNWDDILGYFHMPKSFEGAGADLILLVHTKNMILGSGLASIVFSVINIDAGTLLTSMSVPRAAPFSGSVSNITLSNLGDAPNTWYLVYKRAVVSNISPRTMGFTVVEITATASSAVVVAHPSVNLAVEANYFLRPGGYTVKPSATGLDIWNVSDVTAQIHISAIRIPFPYSAPTITNNVLSVETPVPVGSNKKVFVKEIGSTNYLVVATMDTSTFQRFVGYSFQSPTGPYTLVYDTSVDIVAEYGNVGFWSIQDFMSDRVPQFYGNVPYHNGNKESLDSVYIYQVGDPASTPSGADYVNRFIKFNVETGDAQLPVGYDDLFRLANPSWVAINQSGNISTRYMPITNIKDDLIVLPAVVTNTVNPPNAFGTFTTTELFGFQPQPIVIIPPPPPPPVGIIIPPFQNTTKVVTGIDGTQEILVLPTQCCPPSICQIDKCALACIFISLLPSGPMWDRAKANAMQSYGLCDADSGAVTVCKPQSNCTSLVAHSIYTAYRLADVLGNGLAVSLREANPYTAFDTMDDWLDRLGWIDCFKCRSCDQTKPSPYDNVTECGLVFCDLTAPFELSNATKHAIITSLSRLQMGLIRNMGNINFIIEPLNSVLAKDPACEEGVIYDGSCQYKFTIAKIDDEISAWRRLPCPRDEEQTPKIKQCYTDKKCITNGELREICPMQLAAECVVRSLLPNDGTIGIRQI